MKNKWLLFLVLYFCALTVSLSQLKFVTVMAPLAESLGVSVSQVSWLMAVFTLAGVILAIPGGAVLAKLGPKKLLLTLVVCMFAGNLLGLFSLNSYPLMLISRTLEGVAFAVMLMNGVVLISTWFDESLTGTAIGIFTTFAALGSAAALNLTVPIYQAYGLSSLWIITTVFSALAVLLVFFIIPEPKSLAVSSPAQATADKPALSEVLVNGKTWLLAIGQGCVAFLLFTFVTIYPSLFNGFYGIEPAKANFLGSLNGLSGIPFCILGGVIVSKFKQPAWLLIISFICLAAASVMTAHLSGPLFALHAIFTGVFTGLVISGTLAIAPGVANRPANIGYTVAVINLLYYVGIFVGAPAVMKLVEAYPGLTGWNYAGILATAISLLGLGTSIIILLTSKKNIKVADSEPVLNA